MCVYEKECHMSQRVRDVNEAAFDDELLQADRPVLVDFWAPWCGPCRAMTPAVEAVAEQYGDQARVLKLNVDENPSMSPRFNIRGIPTLILFKDGKEADRLVGLHDREQISSLIRKYM
jgi:thioredoxin 1